MGLIPALAGFFRDLTAEQRKSYAIVGALSRYPNFVNVFLMRLRFQGGRRT